VPERMELVKRFHGTSRLVVARRPIKTHSNARGTIGIPFVFELKGDGPGVHRTRSRRAELMSRFEVIDGAR
jgi:hypothetical protein